MTWREWAPGSRLWRRASGSSGRTAAAAASVTVRTVVHIGQKEPSYLYHVHLSETLLGGTLFCHNRKDAISIPPPLFFEVSGQNQKLIYTYIHVKIYLKNACYILIVSSRSN